MMKSRGLQTWSNFGLYKTVKSDGTKDMLILHFGDAIGFHTRHESKKVLLFTAGEQAKLITK